jgi:hypothetical protein
MRASPADPALKIRTLIQTFDDVRPGLDGGLTKSMVQHNRKRPGNRPGVGILR